MTLVAKGGVLCFQKIKILLPSFQNYRYGVVLGTSLSNGSCSTSSQLIGDIWQRVDEKFRRVYAVLGDFMAMIVFVEVDGAFLRVGTRASNTSMIDQGHPMNAPKWL